MPAPMHRSVRRSARRSLALAWLRRCHRSMSPGSPESSCGRRVWSVFVEKPSATTRCGGLPVPSGPCGTRCRGGRARNYSSETTGVSTVACRKCQLACAAGTSRRLTSANSACRRSFAHTSSTDSAVAWTKSRPRSRGPFGFRSASACQISSTCRSRPSRPRTLFSRKSSVVRQPARSSSRRSACWRMAPCWRWRRNRWRGVGRARATMGPS